MTHLVPKALGDLISARATLAVEFQCKMAALAEKERLLRQTLLDTAPEVLRCWLEEDGILTSLSQSGRCRTELRFGHTSYRLDSLTNFKKTRPVLEELAIAWEGVITVTLDSSEPHRVKIHFAAVL